jgi:hypothetical protein
MKRSVFPIIIALIVLFSVGGIVSWIFLHHERQFLKIEIPESYLETTDTSRFSVQPIILTRSLPNDSVLILFPKKEKQSEVFLYDQLNYNRLLYGDHHGVPIFVPDAEGLSAMFDRPVINFSGFPSGKYYVHVTACDFGGFLQLNISDSLH